MKLTVSKNVLSNVIEAAKVGLELTTSQTNSEDSNVEQIWLITGRLCDALFEMTGEWLSVEDDFDDSLTIKLLKSQMSPEDIADIFMALAFRKENDHDT